MANNILYLAGGLALGLLIAAVFYIIADPSRLEPAYEPAGEYGSNPPLEGGLADLSREIARLARAVDGLKAAPVTQETGEQAPVATEVFTDWISVTDRDLAAVLVENGRTPYDPGMPALFSQAAEELREADRLYGENSVARSELYMNKGLTRESYMAEVESNRKRHQQKREAVLKKLREALEQR